MRRWEFPWLPGCLFAGSGWESLPRIRFLHWRSVAVQSMAPSGSVPRCGGLGLGQHNTIPLPSACMSARSKRLAGPPKKISEAHKVNVAAWSHANGIFVRAQPCVCGRIAACTQVGGLQAARSLSQQGWFFFRVCVCVRLCLHCSLCSGSI